MMVRWVAFGLGNPAESYGGTRHNAGAEAIKLLERAMGGGRHPVEGVHFKGLVSGDILYAVQRCYMNESFLMVEELERMDVRPKNWLVVHDDLALETGRIRVVRGGRSAGHRGIEGVTGALGTDAFARVKIGIAPGAPLDGSIVKDYVLSPFFKEELPRVERAVTWAASAVLSVVGEGVDRSMDRFNGRRAGEGE